MNRRSVVPQEREATMGTFGGVFTPSILTILGIILFLRLGYVVGSAGLGRALIIIGISNAISVLTSISLSAIATNLRVKGGGVYYLISRTLGVEFGGAIGIVLFLAQSVSVAFYCIGFGEALAALAPVWPFLNPQVTAAAAVIFLFVFAWLGADWATRFQYVVMAMLGAALLSFFWGGLSRWDSSVLLANWAAPAGGAGFWILFAIFFPAVTGFTQGVSMSGDLKDPGRSLVLGTLWAVGLSIAVYFLGAVVFAGVLPGSVMMTDYGAMKRVAWISPLIDAGVIAATLSSAMASFLGAPRVLQSLAEDRILPFLLPFAKGVGPAGNPRRGVLLTLGIAGATIALGNLNVIAPVVSMFFLISYGLLNYATFYEARSASPSFRPRFRWFDQRLSLLGFLTCLGAMLAIDPAAGAVAIAALFAIFQYLRRTAGPARWADSRRSYHLKRVREHLLAAAAEQEHPRDWRPQLLVFSNDAHRRGQLLRFASWLEASSGLITAVRVLEGEGLRMIGLQKEAEEELRRDIAGFGLKAFPLVVAAPKLEAGIQAVVQAAGIGPLRANTILLNWLERENQGGGGLQELIYGRNVRVAFRQGCNVVVLDLKENQWSALEKTPGEKRRIDVWWWDDPTSHLTLLLAYLVTRSEAWEGASIRLLAACYADDSEKNLEALRATLDEVRIETEPRIVPNADHNALAAHSHDADLVFLPFRFQGSEISGPLGAPADLLPRLPTTALVLAARDIDLDAEPEEGPAAEAAEALDALSEARKKAQEAEKESSAAAAAALEAEGAVSELKRAGAGSAEEQETLAEAGRTAAEARERAEKAVRRAAKARARVKDAKQGAEAAGATPPPDEETAAEPEETDEKGEPIG